MDNKIFLSFVMLTIILSACTKEADKKESMIIMAYYVAPQNNYTPSALPLDSLTHIIFSFTEVIDNQMKFKNPSSIDKLNALSKQKAYHPNLKVMVACGGWGGSQGFSNMVAEEESRLKFVNSAGDFLKTHNLDGLDIDWEYPGLQGAGNPFRAEDKQNFTALMKELRRAMDATNEKYILSFASAGWQKYYNHIELNKVMQYVDFMNIMTYDFVGGNTPFCAHHTNLGIVKQNHIKKTPAEQLMINQGVTPQLRSTKDIVSFCLNKGVDPGKVVIGAAFYGRGWQGVSPENNGLYQLNRGSWNRPLGYKHIQQLYENKGGFFRYWDAMAQAPYLYNSTDSIFITYDDPLSVGLKVKFARKKGLAGIMFWQLNLDAKHNGLLKAIYQEAEK